MAENDIKLNELCNLLANEVGGSASIASARKYLSALQRVILKELKLNQRIYFFNFGAFEIYESGGYDTKMGDIVKQEGTIYRYIPVKTKILFKPSKVLLNSINKNDFEPIKRKYNKKKIKKQDIEERKAKRRKEKISMEEAFTNMLNNKKEKD